MNVELMSIETSVSKAHKIMTEIIRSMVADPDAVNIHINMPNNNEIVLMVEVGPEDLDDVVGKGGRILQALRTFLNAFAARNNSSIKMQVRPLQL